MYLHIGQDYVVNTGDIIGIFDMDNTTTSHRTREFLSRAEKEGAVIPVNDDLPRSFILSDWPSQNTIYITSLSSAALAGRAAEKKRRKRKP